jgi:5'-nucleotidase
MNNMNMKSKRATKIRIAHINDTHSYFEATTLQLHLNVDNQIVNPYVSVGGFARIKSRAQQLQLSAKESQREFMFLHAGDCFQGTLYFSLFKGKANSTMLNQLNLTAMTLGNHELDMGNGPVAAFAKEINFPLLCGNWDLSNESKDKRQRVIDALSVKPYQPETQSASWITKNVNDTEVAIFGLSIDKMADITTPDPDTPFMNAIRTAKNTVTEIRASGINKIILLSHLGYGTDQKLAEEVDGIGLIVGGHTHVLQGDFNDLGLPCKDDYGIKVNDTFIVQAGMHSQTMGHCDIDFDEHGLVTSFNGRNELLVGRRLCLDVTMTNCNCDGIYKAAFDYLDNHPNVARCAKNAELHKLLFDVYRPQVHALQTTVVGHLQNKLRHVRIPDEQGPSELCPLVAESFYHSMRKIGHQVDFAIHNAGAVRCSLNAGPISKADISGKLLPFTVPVGVYCIQGRYLKPLLEGAIDNAVDEQGTGSGSFPYAYNLDYQLLLEADKGQRVKHLKLYDSKRGWVRIEEDKYYWGTSSAFTMKGKEGYSEILNYRDDWVITEHSMADCFLEFVSNDALHFETQIKLGLNH